MPEWSDGSVDDAALWQAYAWPRDCLRVNFVTSLDGHIAAPDGLSAGFSGPEDRRIFHMLRAGCDAILVGAGTARAERYGPVRLQERWEGLREQTEPPALVFVSSSGRVPDVEGAVTVDGNDLVSLAKDYPRILCEGGPHLFASLLGQGLVDELALSIAGHIGGTGSLIPTQITAHFHPRHVHADGDTVFTLWSRT